MAGQAAEQIIAGVVLSERLAVTMYGAIHRAQFGGQRNLRGLVIEPKLLEEDAFRISLTDQKMIAKITRLEHPSMVPTVAVESGGPDVVVVTRGGGRYATVQDLITRGKLAMPIALAVGKAVLEALSHAHKAGIIHGAVHPRSVLVEDDGSIRLADFIVGRALTMAVSQGADSSLWRGLTGYIAPELVVGEEPAPSVDVFAVGAMLFSMISGEEPPGALRVTPAIERLVQRALDPDAARRYKSATDMLENLVEAIEDDRWELADRQELVREAGLSAPDEAIDDATEDLLASLGKGTVQVTAPRKESEPGDKRLPTGDKRGLDALIADLDDPASGVTYVEDMPARRDPISDIIRSSKRVPSLDDPDEEPPRISSPPIPPMAPLRAHTADERAALAAIVELDDQPKRRQPLYTPTAKVARPIVDPIDHDDVPLPRLKSRWRGIITGGVVLAIIVGAGYMLYSKSQDDQAKAEAAKKDREKQLKEKDELEQRLRAAQADAGAIEIQCEGAGIWLRLGRTPLDTPISLPATQPHDLVLLRAGSLPTEAQVNGTSWTGAKQTLKASLQVALKPAKAKEPAELPLQPTTAQLASTGVVGAGPVHIESTPSDAEAWLFIGANHAQFNNLVAGRDYEVAAVKPGFKTQHVVFKADDWREGGDASVPIDVAKKKQTLSKTIELEPDPDYKPPKKGK